MLSGLIDLQYFDKRKKRVFASLNFHQLNLLKLICNLKCWWTNMKIEILYIKRNILLITI